MLRDFLFRDTVYIVCYLLCSSSACSSKDSESVVMSAERVAAIIGRICSCHVTAQVSRDRVTSRRSRSVESSVATPPTRSVVMSAQALRMPADRALAGSEALDALGNLSGRISLYLQTSSSVHWRGLWSQCTELQVRRLEILLL